MQGNTVSVILWSLHSSIKIFESPRGDWILNRHHICWFLYLTLDIWSNFLKKKKRKKYFTSFFSFPSFLKRHNFFHLHLSVSSCSSRPQSNPTQNQTLTQTSTELNPNLIRTWPELNPNLTKTLQNWTEPEHYLELLTFSYLVKPCFRLSKSHVSDSVFAWSIFQAITQVTPWGKIETISILFTFKLGILIWWR